MLKPALVSGSVGGEVSLECLVSIDSSLLAESEIFWTRDTRATHSTRTSSITVREQPEPVHSNMLLCCVFEPYCIYIFRTVEYIKNIKLFISTTFVKILISQIKLIFFYH